MTARPLYLIGCDRNACDREHTPLAGRTAGEAREHAASCGWTYVTLTSRSGIITRFDLCPDHSEGHAA